MIGSWIAAATRTGWNARPWRNVLTAVAALSLAAAYVGECLETLLAGGSVYVRTDFGLVAGVALMAIGFGSLVTVLVATDALPSLRRLLQARFLLSFGKYSFAIYLTHSVIRSGFREYVIGPYHEGHSPLVTFEELSNSPWVGQMIYYLLAITAAWCIGWLSWNLWEKWFLQLKRWFPY